MSLVVVGDSLLDVDVEGSVHRVCPDAPALVIDEDVRLPRPGGAALAAWLAGEPVTLVTALGDDDEAEVLRDLLDRVTLVAGPLHASTPVKTRVRAGGHTLARLDRTRAGQPVVTEEMVAAVEAADAILVSDYGRGLTADPALRRVLGHMVDRVPVVWDPHPRGTEPVRGATLVTPNLAEAVGLCPDEAVLDDPRAAADTLAPRLRRRWDAVAVAVTLGERGALLAEGTGTRLIPAPAVSHGDPCGAGDRFAIAAAARLMRHDDLPAAVGHAVGAAADFVAAGGAAATTRTPQVTDTDETGLAAARGLIDSVRARGGTVVATGGCFDLLHAGHVRTLTAARGLGDCLVVCLNSDESVRGLKGPGRPLNREGDRAEVLRALGCVDHVVVFAESSPERVLGELRPDVWVKGGDYTPESLPETELVRGWGGEVVVVPYHDGRSTTRLARLLSEAN
jgi:D-beta-D-heptose 7-phosphate kinase / D-beta-D-heptose 1-phosphate adenosyltransferase